MIHARHHRFVTVLMAVLLLLAGYRYVTRSVVVGTGAGSLPAEQVRVRLDPNTATAEELEALPGIGAVRARAIVSYREARQRELGDGDPVFRVAADLAGVKGFGPATIAGIEDHLKFPEPLP